jgi:hypothetical protein
MSLDWDVKACADAEALITGAERGKTEAMVWAMVAVHMSGITAANWREFYTRLDMVERVVGPLMADDVYLTPADVERRIGLQANVNDSKAAFGKHLLAILRRDAERRLRAAPKEKS